MRNLARRAVCASRTCRIVRKLRRTGATSPGRGGSSPVSLHISWKQGRGVFRCHGSTRSTTYENSSAWSRTTLTCSHCALHAPTLKRRSYSTSRALLSYQGWRGLPWSNSQRQRSRMLHLVREVSTNPEMRGSRQEHRQRSVLDDAAEHNSRARRRDNPRSGARRNTANASGVL